jgi:hypothetical protein
VGVSYSRKLLSTKTVNWQFDAEFLPLAYNSDPVQVTTTTVTFIKPPVTFTTTDSQPTVFACHPGSGSGSTPGVDQYTYVNTCTRRWVVGQAMSPAGMRWNFLPSRKLQPFFVAHGGYMYSSQAIPVQQAGNFNFTFDMGAGVEIYRSHTRSLRLEYRVHHISNKETAPANPGIDSGIFQVAYTFGR